MALLRFLLLSGCLGLLPWQVQAASFPERPLTMIIGYAAGGSTDLQGRVLAQILEEQLGQPVIVNNLPGAGGAASAAMLASSLEQGYVFQFGGSSVVSIAPLLSPASFGVDNFTYVAGLSLEQPAFVTGATRGISDWPALLTYLRANPGQVYVSQAAEDRLILRAIAKREGLHLRTVPTSGGAGMAPLVISGDAVFAYSGGTHTGYTESGEMRVLVSLADERWVPVEHADSNAGLLKQYLLKGPAAKAQFLSLYSAAANVEQAAEQADRLLAELPPIDVLVLGMGDDGHTASLFPDSPNLTEALQADGTRRCWPMLAPSVPRQRLTMSRALLASARHKILSISGQSKLTTLNAALASDDVAAMPVRAFLQPTLEIYWCP